MLNKGWSWVSAQNNSLLIFPLNMHATFDPDRQDAWPVGSYICIGCRRVSKMESSNQNSF